MRIRQAWRFLPDPLICWFIRQILTEELPAMPVSYTHLDVYKRQTLEYLEYVQDEVDIFDVSCGLNGSIQYQIDANYMKDG